MAFRKGNANHPSKRRQGATAAAREKALAQRRKTYAASSRKRSRSKKNVATVDLLAYAEKALAKSQQQQTSKVTAARKAVKRKARRKKRRVSTIDLLNKTGPVNFDDVDKSVANDKANRLVQEMLESLVVNDRASAIATLKYVIGKLHSKITPTDIADDPEADRVIVDTLVGVLDSTLAVKGGVETDRLVTKKILLAIVAKASATDDNLNRRIEKRVGLAQRARAQRNYRTGVREYLQIYDLLKHNPKLAREKMVYRAIRFNRVPRDLLREFWFLFLTRVESNRTEPRTCRWTDDNGNKHTKTHVYRSIQYTIDDSLLILNTWQPYKAYLEKGGIPVTTGMLREGRCSCMKKETSEACVNQVKCENNFALEALRNVYNQPGMKKRLDECPCDLHGEGTWEDIFTGEKGMLSTLAEMTLCRKEKIDHLCLPGGDDFWQRPKDCVIFGEKIYGQSNSTKCDRMPYSCKQNHGKNPICGLCGIHNLQFCPVLNDGLTTTEVKQFGVTTRENGHKEVEVISIRMSAKDIIARIKRIFPCWSANLWEGRYFKRCRDVMKANMRPLQLCVCHDWAATTVVVQKYEVNCGTPNTIQMECYVVQHSPKEVDVPEHKEGGRTVAATTKIVFETDVFYFWLAATGHKGNNWKNSNGNLAYVAEHYREKFGLTEENWSESMMFDCTDAAPTQYANKYKHLYSAEFASKHLFRKTHWIAPYSAFKGLWDAMNKVARQAVNSLVRQGKCIITRAIEFAYMSAQLVSKPKKIYGNGEGQTPYWQMSKNSVTSYHHIMIAPNEGVADTYRTFIQQREGDPHDHDTGGVLEVIVIPECSFDVDGISGSQELYSYRGGGREQPQDLYVRRRCGACPYCLHPTQGAAVGEGCLPECQALCGRWFPVPQMIRRDGNNNAAVTRTATEKYEKRISSLKRGAFLARLRDAGDEQGGIEISPAAEAAAMDERAYTLCKITQAPRKSKGANKTTDCWGKGVPKGQYYVKVDDFIIYDESDRLHKRSDDDTCLGAICRIKKTDCIFFDSLIRVFSENESTGFVRVTSGTHDNLNGLYQQSRTAPQVNTNL